MCKYIHRYIDIYTYIDIYKDIYLDIYIYQVFSSIYIYTRRKKDKQKRVPE